MTKKKIIKDFKILERGFDQLYEELFSAKKTINFLAQHDKSEIVTSRSFDRVIFSYIYEGELKEIQTERRNITILENLKDYFVFRVDYDDLSKAYYKVDKSSGIITDITPFYKLKRVTKESK